MTDTPQSSAQKIKKGRPYRHMEDDERRAAHAVVLYRQRVIKEALRRASCDVMIAYPIPPQS